MMLCFDNPRDFVQNICGIFVLFFFSKFNKDLIVKNRNFSETTHQNSEQLSLNITKGPIKQ